MIISHDVGKSISLMVDEQAQPTWVLNYGSTPKPHFSSLRTPAGHELAIVEPVDHLWHRGLWFTIKYVNEVNFWEERDEFGVHKVAGIPQISHHDNAVTIAMDIDWIGPARNVPIRESRTIVWQEKAASFTLDWSSKLVARADLKLDRTPFTTWGGYSGLSFRGARTWHPQRFLMPAREENPLPAGIKAPWLDLSGSFDGGPDRHGGLAIIDRSGEESSWYAGGDQRNTFINAAFLFDAPIEVTQGETMEFSYRVVVHDDIWTTSDLRPHLEANT
jgi:hypothetical protein